MSRILAAVHRELGTRGKDLATALLARLRAGAFSLRASTDLTGMPALTFQVAPGIEPTDAMLVTEVLDAIEAELEERNLTLAIGLDEFQRLGRWYGDDVGWQLKLATRWKTSWDEKCSCVNPTVDTILMIRSSDVGCRCI